MRKSVLFIAVLLFMAVPAMAVSNITITCTDDDVNEIVISYDSNSNWIRAFGLDINTGEANIVKVVVGEPNYRIYPGQIDIVDGQVESYGTPYAGDLNTPAITIEMGSLYTMDPCYAPGKPLYDPNAGYNKKPLKSGILLKVYTDGNSCHYIIDANTRRGGIVMEDPCEIPTDNLPCEGDIITGYTIAGTVSGATQADVTMNGLPSNPVTDGSGNYSDTVPAGWSGTVTPTKTCYTFTPTNRVYSSVMSDMTSENYTAAIVPPPPAPATITVPANDADGKYAVTWSSVAEATSYKLESSCSEAGTTVYPLWVQVYSGTATTYNEKVGGCTWSYRVKAINACGESGYTTGGNTCVVTNCLIGGNAGASELSDWKKYRCPACWCYSRQCRGDADGKSKMVGGWVSGDDLGILRNSYGKTPAQIAAIPNGFCPDFDHKNKMVGGRVSGDDLTILRVYYGDAAAAIPLCDVNDPPNGYKTVYTGPYNYWTTP